MNEEIFGGLKAAIERGESLKRAMMTFFNAGYKREEIEEAARALYEILQHQQQVQQPVKNPVNTPIKTQIVKSPIPTSNISPVYNMPPVAPVVPSQKQDSIQKIMPAYPPVQILGQPQISPANSMQKVSNYSSDKKDKRIIYLLIAILIFLFGVLITILIFKQELINLLSSMIS
jgi:hypothetical protein